MVSAYNDTKERQLAHQSNADGFISKPLNIKKLTETLSNLK